MSSADRPNQTLADYVALAISPALIVGLVSSLVFFLLEVFYRADGEWKGRLQWILFFFVFGAVLVARISMTGDIAPRSKLYGPVLAGLTYLGMQMFVEYPEGGLKELSFLINLFLVGVVWWCAHRITWDCTNVDEEADMNGEGLLQAAGLEEAEREEGAEEAEAGETKPAEKKPSWWERFQRYREQRDKRRTLGVWVVYFSLAALPLFGLGQSLIPLTAPGRRQFAFWLMAVYVGCGLGLLMTTCFLSLRRYLRQRRLQMPAAMTGTWLMTGGGLIAVLLLVGALLPRPYPEYALFDITGTSSAKRKASDYALKGGPTGEGEGRPGQARPDGKQGEGQPGKGEPGQGPKGQGQPGQGKQEQGQPGEGPKGQGSKDGGRGNDQGDRNRSQGGPGDKDGRSKTGQALKDMEKGQQKGDSGGSSSPRTEPLSRLSQALGRVAPVLKWVVFAVLIVVVVFFVLRGGLQFLANFTDWARRLLEAWRNFWANLFGGRKPERAAEAEAGDEAESEGVPERPFADFANPFDSGAAGRWPARELVKYTFAALQAWARERDLGRQPGETPQEFSERVAGEVPALEADVCRLAALYARAVYARGGLPGNTAEVVRQFWERLERVASQPLSA
jgi:hypothetical protein